MKKSFNRAPPAMWSGERTPGHRYPASTPHLAASSGSTSAAPGRRAGLGAASCASERGGAGDGCGCAPVTSGCPSAAVLLASIGDGATTSTLTTRHPLQRVGQVEPELEPRGAPSSS